LAHSVVIKTCIYNVRTMLTKSCVDNEMMALIVWMLITTNAVAAFNN